MRAAITPAVLVALLAGACRGDTQSACGRTERLIEPSAVHVIGDAEVVYQHSPPTSGPHRVPAPSAGVYGDPVREAAQVGALEGGMVIVQYAPEVDAAVVALIEPLGDTEGVLVAPGARDFDDDAKIALTAWGVRQLCAAFDAEAALAFIDRYQGAVFVDHASG